MVNRLVVIAFVALVVGAGAWCWTDRRNEDDADQRAPASDPTLDPVIGTRVEKDGVLTPVDAIDTANSRYIGCDLNVAGLMKGTEIEVVWIFKPAVFTDRARVIQQFWASVDGRNETLRVWVDQVRDPGTRDNAVGSYECVWSLARRGASARLTVRAAR